jgi:hypothetical protein
MVFPMSLTIMEEFLLLEDRPSCPNLMFFRTVFSGQVDRRAFDAALKRAVGRHPFFRAIVEQNTAGRFEPSGHAESKKTQKFVFRSVLRSNQRKPAGNPASQQFAAHRDVSPPRCRAFGLL